MKNNAQKFMLLFFAITSAFLISSPFKVNWANEIIIINRERAIEIALDNSSAYHQLLKAEEELEISYRESVNNANDALFNLNALIRVRHEVGDLFPEETSLTLKENYLYFYKPQLIAPEVKASLEKIKLEKSNFVNTQKNSIDTLLLEYLKLAEAEEMMLKKMKAHLSEKAHTQEKYDLGYVPYSTLRNVENDLNQAKVEYQIASLNTNESVLNIKNFLGIPLSTAISIQDDFIRLRIQPHTVNPSAMIDLASQNHFVKLASVDLQCAQEIEAIHQRFYYNEEIRLRSAIQLERSRRNYKDSLVAAQADIQYTLYELTLLKDQFNRSKNEYEAYHDYFKQFNSHTNTTALDLVWAEIEKEGYYNTMVQNYRNYVSALDRFMLLDGGNHEN